MVDAVEHHHGVVAARFGLVPHARTGRPAHLLRVPVPTY
jgi:hypothetical protein